MKQKRTKIEMQEHLSRWKESGLSHKAYCQNNDIPYFTFKYWHDKLTLLKSRKPFRELKVTGEVNTHHSAKSAKIEFHIPQKGYFVFSTCCSPNYIKSLLGL